MFSNNHDNIVSCFVARLLVTELVTMHTIRRICKNVKYPNFSGTKYAFHFLSYIHKNIKIRSVYMLIKFQTVLWNSTYPLNVSFIVPVYTFIQIFCNNCTNTFVSPSVRLEVCNIALMKWKGTVLACFQRGKETMPDVHNRLTERTWVIVLRRYNKSEITFRDIIKKRNIRRGTSAMHEWINREP